MSVCAQVKQLQPWFFDDLV